MSTQSAKARKQASTQTNYLADSTKLFVKYLLQNLGSYVLLKVSKKSKNQPEKYHN